MKIGLAGPCNPQALRDLLTPPDAERAPSSDPGVPVEALARALIARGHSVTVYTLTPTVFQPLPLTLRGPQLTLHLGTYRLRHRMRDFFGRERQQITAFIQADPPDVLNAHWGYEYALAAQAAAVAPVVITQHDWAPTILFWQPTPYRLGRLALFLTSLLRAIRGPRTPLVCPSPYLARRLKRWLGQDSTLIPNGLLLAATPLPRQYPGTPPLLLAINQGFSRFKNVRLLLRAFPRIRAVHPGACLRLLGHGHGPGGPAERWATARGLTTGVEFIGQVSAEQVRQELARAHVLVHPSRTESFGLVLIEAMAQGTPVIAAETAEGPRWVLADGKAGVLSSIRGPRPFADSCLRLLDDPTRWEELSRHGQEMVASRFSMQQIAEAYERLYRSVLSP